MFSSSCADSYYHHIAVDPRVVVSLAPMSDLPDFTQRWGRCRRGDRGNFHTAIRYTNAHGYSRWLPTLRRCWRRAALDLLRPVLRRCATPRGTKQDTPIKG